MLIRDYSGLFVLLNITENHVFLSQKRHVMRERFFLKSIVLEEIANE